MRIASSSDSPFIPRRRMQQAAISLSLCALVAACGGGGGSSGTSTSTPQVSNVQPADAARMAEQSSFGPTDALVTQIQQAGFDAYLTSQFNTPATGYPGLVSQDVDPSSSVTCPTGSAATCFRDNYTAFPVQLKFYQNALTGSDQLRQRVAFALSQILVASDVEVQGTYAIAQYQQTLLDNAFGNFRDILLKVTLSPAMGDYLNMVNSTKNSPNENFGREVLQLFSVGLFQLNQDGTQKLDAQGNPIPTYDQSVITGFASAFTGFTYAPRPGQAAKFPSPPYYIGQMVSSAANHDTGTKQLLNGATLPAGQTPDKDLTDAIDNIFKHDNVGPFIGTRLIQQLVTSNPSPAYVSRVAGAFNNNGNGVRGDMQAVIRAILLDPEARGDVKTDVNYGKLREPALFMASVMRALGGTSDGVYLNSRSSQMLQKVFSSPSVFNFYPPDYGLPGSDVLSPEFAITNTATALQRANIMNELILGAAIKPDTSVAGSTGTTIDWTSLQGLAADSAKLTDRLNTLMMHNAMSSAMRTTIINAVEAVPSTDPLKRARTAVYLAATSAQYMVEK
jgi:uncharacterized protein (DUF1800 family)